MSNQKNILHPHMSASILFLVYCIGWSTITYADVAVTSVQISFDLEKDPRSGRAEPIFDALKNVYKKRELVEELEAEAVTYCITQFPYLNWVGASQPGVTPESQARLEILMKAKKGLGWEVYLECTTMINGARLDKPAKAIVYDVYAILPDRKTDSQKEIKDEILKKTQEALIKLIPNGSDLIKVIPLANTIHADPNGQRLIVPPITADKLNAERESLLSAKFISVVEEGIEEDVYIEFQPSGQVRGADDPLKGMQKFLVTLFDWDPIYHKDWHVLIPDAINKRIDDNVRVYMKDYKQKHKMIVENLEHEGHN